MRAEGGSIGMEDTKPVGVVRLRNGSMKSGACR